MFIDGVRQAARAIVVDEAGCVLLLNGVDPGRPDWGNWWFTPGGGLEPGETLRAAATRELAEETGLTGVELGEQVFESTTQVPFDGAWIAQHNVYFLIVTPHFEIDRSGWTPEEVECLITYRWWSPDELRSTTERFYPVNLVDLLPG